MGRRVRWVVAALATGWLAAAGAGAQVGSTTDIISGKVLGPPPARHPVSGATVSVMSLDTRITRSRVTNSDGRYAVVFPDGGGQYRIEIRSVGYAPATRIVSRQADEDRLVADVELNTAVPTIQTINVRARANNGRDAANAGTTRLTLTPSQIEKLPIDGSDFATLATLAPGVVGIGATDTTASAFSVAGQRPTLNAVTVDGVSFGGTSVPTEAVRNIRVVTNSYDVSRGQFTGGQIATTTRGGTNDLSGSFGTTARNAGLAFGTQGPPAFGQLRNQLQLSGGLGGPIVHDKLFTFTAIQISRRYDDLTSLLNADPNTLAALGITRDTAQTFINHVRALGLPVSGGNIPSVRGTTSIVAFERLDYLVTDDQTLTLRLDYRATVQDGSRISVFSLPTVGAANANAGGGVLLALTSHIGVGTINDLRAYASHAQTSLDPYFKLPSGRVTIVPQLPDTDTTEPLGFGVSSLTLGGSPAVAQSTFNDFVEATDEVSLMPGDGVHRIKLGALVNIARTGQHIAPNQEGVYTYQSLAAFQADSPATFTRTLNVQNTEARAFNGAVYLGDAWRAGPLQVTYGARLEGATYGGAPAFDPTIDSLFHRRTDDWPSEIHASPRAGFTWFVGSGSGGARMGGGANGRNAFAIIRGGFGEFRAPVPRSLLPSLQSATGAAGSEAQLFCVGPQVPPPDWAGYNDGTAPTACTTSPIDVFPIDSLGLGARKAVTTFAPDFEAPRAWRGSLGATKRFLGRLTVAVDGTYARGQTLFGVTDLNLNTAPRFALTNEGDRPVFVSPLAIDPRTGAAAFGDSRLYPRYGQVLSLNSNLQSETRQVTTSVSGFTDHGMLYSLAYTYSHVRDQSSFAGGSAVFGFASATTAGNPNVVPFGTSDLQRQHQMVGTVTYPITPLVELTAIVQLNSGTPYSPLVNGDVNGDGVSRNDRAFVFNPATPGLDPAVAAAMRTLLTGPARIRDCLASQVGAIAARNSCTGPWTTSLSWQLNVRPNALGLDRRLTLSVQILNTLTGLDLLLHGPNHLQGWGQPSPPDPTLLTVTGFDPATNQYRYAVNTHFGRASANQAYGQPFQLVLAGRLNVGPADAAQQLRSLFSGGGRGGRGGGGGGAGGSSAGATGADPRESLADGIADRFGGRIRNPLTEVIALKDSLELTPAQLDTLGAASTRHQASADSITGVVRAQLKNLGATLDATTMSGITRRQTTAVRDLERLAVDTLRAILTPAQWAKLPERLANPQAPAGQRRDGRPPR